MIDTASATVFRRVQRGACGPIVVLALIAGMAVGCSGTVKDRVMTGSGSGPGPIDEAKTLIQRYANGEPMGSEAMVFDDLVKRVTAADAGKGAKLKKYLDSAQKRGVDATAAKALLKDL